MTPDELRAGLDELADMIEEYRSLEEEAEDMADTVDLLGEDSEAWDAFHDLQEELDDLVDQIVALADELGIDGPLVDES